MQLFCRYRYVLEVGGFTVKTTIKEEKYDG